MIRSLSEATSKRASKRVLLALLVGSMMAFAAVSPASAHVSSSVKHLWGKHIKASATKLFYTKKQSNARYYTKSQVKAAFVKKSTLSTAGTINSTSNPVDWTKLKGVPSGIADGNDSDSGGDLTSLTAGDGLSGGGSTGALSIEVDFAGSGAAATVARSDHDHDGDYVTGVSPDSGSGLQTSSSGGRLYVALIGCSDGEIMQWDDGLPGWGCTPIPTGDITAVAAGAGLINGGGSGTVTLDVDFGTSAGTVAEGDHAHSEYLKKYCEMVDASPGSFPAAPCMKLEGVLDTDNTERVHATVGADGMPVLARHNTTGGTIDLFHCKIADCSSFDGPTAMPGTVGSFSVPRIGIGSDGRPYVGVVEGTSDKIIFTRCADIACSSLSTPVTLDANQVFSSMDIITGSDGYPAIAYKENGSGAGVKFTHCTSLDCSSRDTPVTLDSSGSGNGIRMVMGSDGMPVMSFYRSSGSQARVVHCTSDDCSSFDPPLSVEGSVLVDANALVPVTVGSDGKPVIFFVNNSASEDVYAAKCADVSCSSAGSPVQALSAVEVTSMAFDGVVGPDGLPGLIYAESGSAAIKMVSCENAACTSFGAPSALGTMSLSIGKSSATLMVDGGWGVFWVDTGSDDSRFTRFAP